MRCISCDCNLNDYESTRKYEDGTYVDMCGRCFRASDMGSIAVIEREDLIEYEDVTDGPLEEL